MPREIESINYKFHSQLPPDLTDNLDKHTRYIYDALDVLRQQNEYIIREQIEVKFRLESSANEFNALKTELAATKERLAAYDRLYLAFTSKKSVFVGISTIFILPIAIIVLGQWLVSLIIKSFKS